MFCLSHFRQQFVPAVDLACLYRGPLYFCRKLVSDSGRVCSNEPLLLRWARLLFWTLPHAKNSLQGRQRVGRCHQQWLDFWAHGHMPVGHSIDVWNCPSVVDPETWFIMHIATKTLIWHPLQICSSSLAKLCTPAFPAWSLVFIFKSSRVYKRLDCLEQSSTSFCVGFLGWG